MSGAGLELHDAASTGDYDALEEYIKSGKYDVNLKDIDTGNRTALHWACQKGFAECIRLLLDHGAKGTARTTSGWTPAHCAAESNRIPALRALHAAFVPVDLHDKYGDTPRRIATIYGHRDCARYLLQYDVTYHLPPEGGRVIQHLHSMAKMELIGAYRKSASCCHGDNSYGG